jgi:glycosyltransferase involved in cell wall biosynthesis
MPAARATRVLVLTPDTVGPRMAGPGIRSFELARVLATEHDVTLASPYPVEREAPGVAGRRFADDADLRQLVGEADVVVALASLLHEHPWMAAAPSTGARRPVLVADAYDPVLFEVLELASGASPDRAERLAADALLRMTAPLAVADVVLCASERQRHLLLGMLAALGRINPDTHRDDPELARLVEVVPFGLPSTPPDAGGRHPLRAPEGPFGPDDVVLLWGGGLYDWLDPVTLVEAVARIDDPAIKACFLAGRHPTPAVPEMATRKRTVDRAEALGLTGGDAPRVWFADQWVPYDERAAWLLDADLSVSLHRPGLEATFAYRTRLLDAVWAGLPVVCTAGDTLADQVAADGLGAVVPPGDPQALAEAVVRLREPRCYAAARLALASLAPASTWERVAQPLVELCRHPALAPDRVHPTRAAGGRRADSLHAARAVAGRLRSAAGRLRPGPPT